LSVLLRRSAIAAGGGGRDLVHTLGRSMLFGVGILIACDTLGISITPILASLGVGSVAVALALQGTLGDFFSGIYLIIDRPVRTGDFVRMDSGLEGQVVRIGWRSTELKFDGRMIVVPNSKLATSVITNLTLPDMPYTFKVEVGVGYGSDLANVRKILEDEVAKAGASDAKIRFTSFGDSSVTTTIFAKAPDFDSYFLLRSNLIEGIHKRFQTEGIDIPFPQRVVRQVT
jgi:small-conductance mechanosensitive channel